MCLFAFYVSCSNLRISCVNLQKNTETNFMFQPFLRSSPFTFLLTFEIIIPCVTVGATILIVRRLLRYYMCDVFIQKLEFAPANREPELVGNIEKSFPMPLGSG